ncbi:hypothetical protein A3F37_03250 [Candidatus Saccharibacteria bacterium RIFCSPHIGHO2_12_FULL_41_12]|nr:MAG: hypothetical protein A3F37_03250 [Candidatus Saccharibacteria bacterium RIFCSPHIGHO2_12_FULL_41_12]
MTTKTKTPENPIIKRIDGPGHVNRITTSDMRRDFENVGDGASPDAYDRADRDLRFLSELSGGFLCEQYMKADEAERREIVTGVIVEIIDATDTILLGPIHPAIDRNGKDVKFFAGLMVNHEIDPEVDGPLTQDELLPWIVDEIATPLVEGEFRAHSNY